jgi:hypothetical protein
MKTLFLSSLIGLLALTGGCTTLDRAFNQQVAWTNAPVVQVVTNTVLATNLVE